MPDYASLWRAVKQGNVPEVTSLLPKHPRFDNYRQHMRTLIHVAAKNGHVEVIKTLIEFGSKTLDTPDDEGFTPMHGACLNGHADVIELLVQLGSSAIDTPDNYNCTPFHLAVYNGHLSAIQMLVRLGSRVIDTPNKLGDTPMHIAATRGHVSVVEMLVRLGSRAIDTPNNNGLTPMHTAATWRHSLVIEQLARLGSCAMDTRDKIGNTPMHTAVLRDTSSTLSLKLLGADCSSLNIPNHVPTEVVNFLTSPIDEDKAEELRHQVYFRRSLIERLMVELEARHYQRHRSSS